MKFRRRAALGSPRPSGAKSAQGSRGSRRAQRLSRRVLTLLGACLMIAGIAAIPSGVLFGTARPAAAAPATSYVPVNGAGSTWSANAIDAWIANVKQFGIRINYTASGSTAGRETFALDTQDFGASEIPYGVKDGDVTDPPPKRGYAYMPDTAGGTTFMYNLRVGNTQVKNLRLSGKAIAEIFTGVLTNWDNPLIQSENPGIKMPNLKIVPVVRGDGSGATAEFTEWMLATQPSYWKAYCAKVGFSPCTQTSAYPVLPNSAMHGANGDLGVSGYVSQPQSVGTIGYVEYSYALADKFPVALVLNQDGYYTEPTAQNVAVSLLKAKINSDKSSALYLTQDLSGVYTDKDPRTYELSSYSYMILPTSVVTGFNTQKGFTLGAFGQYLLCQGQTQVDELGYSALPINLVKAGYAQLAKIPGAQIPATVDSQIQGCHNPTFSTNGTNTLVTTDKDPAACDKAGPTQCVGPTGGADNGAGAQSNNNSGSSGGSNTGNSGSGGGNAGNGNSSNGTSSSGTGSGTSGSAVGAVPSQSCDQATGVCSSSGNGTGTEFGALGNQTVNGEPVAAEQNLGDGVQITLMVLGGALLVGLGIIPPLLGQAGARRRQRRMDSYFDGDDQ
ncbi:MAG TPA: phosphate ABC transporter substrate-binding protein PstS [Trebonia sp.]|nr:phosphate ABC transporter substrate-binding protein PstS [Trebonia sp.]